jgi:hypothetical protein
MGLAVAMFDDDAQLEIALAGHGRQEDREAMSPGPVGDGLSAGSHRKFLCERPQAYASTIIQV